MVKQRLFLLTALMFVVASPTASPAVNDWPFNYAQRLGPELERLCVGVSNSYNCAQAIERFQLGRGVPGISRQKRDLTIRPKWGRRVVLRDHMARPRLSVTPEDFCDKCYSYLKTLPEVGYHLVHIQHWEGDEYLLVGMHSGAQFIIQAVPVISPDRSRFVTGFPNLEGYNNIPNAIQIWRFTPKGPRLEWTFEPDNWEPSSLPEWLSPRKIRVVMRDIDGTRIGKALIVHAPHGWELARAEE